MKRLCKRAFVCICVLFCELVMTVSLAGCADSSLQEENSMKNSIEEMETIPSDSEKAGEEIISPVTDVEISDKNATVFYAGEEFIKSVFGAGGTMLYVCGIKGDGSYFLGYMQKEEDVFQEFDVGMGEGLRALNMAVDRLGRCHILWMSVEKYELNGQSFDRVTYDESYITIVDREGKLEKEIDVSGIFASRQKRPFCFAVDEEGNYYFEDEKELIQLMSDGTEGMSVAGDGWIEGIGTGKSGTVYCTTYSDENGARMLTRLEGDSLSTCDAELPEADAIYAGIHAGTDSELLIINKKNGIFAFDGNGTEVRVPGTEMPITGAEIVGYGILSDGRACIMTQEDGTTIFYYIPSGK